MKTLTDLYIEHVLTPMMTKLIEDAKKAGHLPNVPAIEIEWSYGCPVIWLASFGGAK